MLKNKEMELQLVKKSALEEIEQKKVRKTRRNSKTRAAVRHTIQKDQGIDGIQAKGP
jgi:hypothetical protein